MGLFSFLSKNKQEPASGGEFYSKAEEDSQVARGRGKRKNKAANANEPVDPVLPEKKRARRRLVGAVALVLAMVIGLPMILDSEPRPLADDIAIQIPSKDKQAVGNPDSVADADVSPSASAAASASASVTASASAVASVPVASSLGQQEQVVPMPKPVVTAPVVETAKPTPAPAPVVVKPAPELAKPVVTAPPASQPNSVAIKPETAAEKRQEARVEAILGGKDVSKPVAENKTGKFVIQVAALASQEKVTELQNKLSEAGIKSYAQKVPTDAGERIRVRVGPFNTKDEAENARAKLNKLGLSSQLMPT